MVGVGSGIPAKNRLSKNVERKTLFLENEKKNGDCNNFFSIKQLYNTEAIWYSKKVAFFLRSKIQIVQILMIDYYAEILTNWHHLSRMLVSTNK